MSESKPTFTEKLSPSAERIVRQVESRQTRLERGKTQNAEFWKSLAFLGLVGWSVVLPTLMGAALGIWLDRHWPSRFSWTLVLLISGLLVGCANVWIRIGKDQP
ncbi:MAG TPA: AtpZ/AtpI family protein [Terriglobales bacterium]|nr:AtpZ/AtpI family protein [Terriglobales bacterium]